MPRRHRHALIGLLLLSGSAGRCLAQQPLTWEQIRERFRANNPTLMANQLAIDESRDNEITAGLRPNPDITGTIDQLNPFSTQPPPSGGPSIYSPLAFALPSSAISYLHERQHKRELRLASARQATAVEVSASADQERTLLYNLRNAFVQTLQAKAVRDLARENLAYYDRALGVNQDRYKAGDISHLDLQRLQLQRVQYESDLQTAEVNLRTAKIQLLTLLNDRTPVERFDISGPFDFSNEIAPLEEFQRMALETRPDLKAAMQSVEKAKTDHRLAIANGSTDPTFSLDFARNPPIPVYMGASVSIPLRIFDRNQGEKARTQVDISRNERLRDATEAQVYSDVDSAYATLTSAVTLLRSYKATYLQEAVDVRDSVSFAYQHGGASLLDFLDAQKSYRDVQLSYLNLTGSYLTAASQMNLAVGREVIQ